MTTTHKHFLGLIFGTVLVLNFLSGCGGGGGGSHGSNSATLASIEVTPTNPSIAIGTSQQFKATGIYSDKTKKDLTSSVTWSSTSPAAATVSDTAGSKGLAKAVSEGPTTIKATSGTISGSTTLTIKADTVTLVSIEVTPTNPSIALGTKQQFTATGIFSDNSKHDLTTQVTWSSSNTGFATIDNAGLATSVAAGAPTITAVLLGKSGDTTLTVKAASIKLVSIEVAPINPSIALGTTQQFTATGIFSDNSKQDLTTQVTWSSSNTGFATIDNAGLATSVAAGSTTITATLGSVPGNTTLTVTSATLVSIEISPTNPSIAKGLTQQFTATGVFSDGTNTTTQDLTKLVTWGSGTLGVATIDNPPGTAGLATAVGVGSTTITATLGGKSGNTTLTVTDATLSSIAVDPTNPSIPKGLTLPFTATGTFSDGTTQELTQVTWSSFNEGVATISNAGDSGLATSFAAGSTTIMATFGGVSGETVLTVTDATLSYISVTPANQSLPKGLTLEFTATGTFSDGSTHDLTTQVTWSSANTLIASVDNASGLATAVDLGTTTITATSTLGGAPGSTTLTVTDAILQSITVTPSNQKMALGTKLQYTAIGKFSGNVQQDLTTQVTWSSSNTGVAVISNGAQTKGLATAIGVGSTTITATFGGKSGNTTLTVTTTAFSSIEVTPATPSIAVGAKLPFTATGHFPDGSTQNLTLSATWSSTDKTVATVSNARKTRGVATGIKAGQTTIRATSSGMSGTTTLTVE